MHFPRFSGHKSLTKKEGEDGEYWIDDIALYFRRYLTKDPVVIPFAKFIEVKIGKSHAGRWLLGPRVLKLIWEKDGMKLSSGFIISRNQQETEAVMADLKRRCSWAFSSSKRFT